MKKTTIAAAMLLAFAPFANAAVEPVIDGSTYTFTVESGTETYSTTLSGAIKVVKEGAGILDLGTGANTFTGGIEVNGGTLKGSFSALGGTGSTAAHGLVKVASGASLVIANTTGSGSTRALAVGLQVGGHGVNSEGAVQRTGGDGSLHGLFQNITLTADTTFSANTRWGVGAGNLPSTLDMNGHKLNIMSVESSFEFYKGPITILNPGDIELLNKKFLMQASVYGESGTMTLDNGTEFSLFGETTPFPWSIAIPENAVATVLGAGSNASRAANVLSGDMDVGKRVVFDVNDNRTTTLAGGLDGKGELRKIGTGTLYVTGNVDRTIGELWITNGTFVLENAGRFSVTNWTVGSDGFIPNTPGARIAGGWSSVPRMTVKAGSLFTMPKSADKTAAGTEKHHLFVGKGEYEYGILEIQQGAVVSNDLNVARNGGSVGAVYLNGGKLFWRGGSANQGWLGHEGVGYMAINDGSEFVSEGLITMGKKGRSNNDMRAGIGIVHQRGGSVRTGSSSIGAKSLRIARETNSYGHWYQKGGSFEGVQDAVLCWADGDLKQDNVEAVVTLSGKNTTMSFSDNKYLMAYVATNRYAHTGVVNINDGATLTVRKMYKNVGDGTKQTTLFSDADFLAEIVNCKFYVNFDGGVLKVREYGTFFNYGSEASKFNDDPDRVTVYAGGAVVDTSMAGSGTKITSWNVPIKKPSGNVLLSVSLPTSSSFVNNNKYIAPPRVVISGVNTHGATAVAEFDEANQRLTGITVTSPGNDVPDDITVTIRSGDLRSTFNCPFTVGAPAKDGGLTKRGDNILDLDMSADNPNTYEGPTTVEGGTLKFNKDTYPPSSPLVLKGGKVDFVGYARTIPSVEGYGEIAGSGGVTVTNELRISCSDLFGEGRSISAQKITLGDGVKLVVTDPENLASYKDAKLTTFLTASTSLSGPKPALELDESYGQWRCVKSGNSLKFGVPGGMTLIFR